MLLKEFFERYVQVPTDVFGGVETTPRQRGGWHNQPINQTRKRII